MKKTDFTVCHDLSGGRHVVSREEMENCRRDMENTFAQLLEVRPEDGLYWTGPATDLMELTYMVYANGLIRDADGYPVSMASLARRICANLHAPMPSNLYKVAAQARQRKGIRRPPLLERCVWLRRQGIEEPLHQELDRRGTSHVSSNLHIAQP